MNFIARRLMRRALCLQSFAAMTYRFRGELSDSHRVRRLGARRVILRGAGLPHDGAGGLELGTSQACVVKIPACISGTGNSFVALV
jgi:hypothetical protein